LRPSGYGTQVFGDVFTGTSIDATAPSIFRTVPNTAMLVYLQQSKHKSRNEVSFPRHSARELQTQNSVVSVSNAVLPAG
jgi:hypothetical protein